MGSLLEDTWTLLMFSIASRLGPSILGVRALDLRLSNLRVWKFGVSEI